MPNRKTVVFCVLAWMFYVSVDVYATHAAGRRDAAMMEAIEALHETNQRQTRYIDEQASRIDDFLDTVSWLSSKVIQRENADPLPEKADFVCSDKRL